MELENGFPPYPDFLKIFNSHEHAQRLVIPRGYNKYYPNPLPQTAVLKKPEGSFWNVKWTISQEETIRFQEGWEKFVKDNGLIDRDFLLFTYDGCRSFWVRIHRNGLPLEPTAPIKIQEISDDEDDTIGHGDHHMEEGDSHENMIVSLSLGSSDEADDDDDYDTTICEVNKASESSKKAGRLARKHRADSIAASIDPETYLDDPKNPFFISTSSCSRRVLVIARQVIKDYDLNFDGTIKLIDGFGELTRKVGKWKDRVVVYKWDEMFTRNKANQGDAIICEVIREEDVVRSIKVHFVKN
ncbi:B3 domain-containing protein At5g57720 isoform X1 [Arabidopsis lyrata subsp. lyrata]|uniref:B3 domain-containing protein At5g57720 isoform X1 n=1 Tax=Arabidopsis lyrata subsp. lyrata TaxID=81972 RepID=UPI000A29D5DB|nr:B3 domain-containing protein At5g57720 isoform X1 [Arabidopsis lyrata subsp. lyrata]|eukprot:XP_020881209.1 B3 domain-containing protein At5g57720 isoform X1 [Arabidopsis lyrata subsp. lyrata]